MTKSTNKMINKENQLNNDKSSVDSVNVLSEFTRKDIEKSYSLDVIKGTQAYFSNRYGWTLRKTID